MATTPAAAGKKNLHDAFVAYLVKGHSPVTVFLTNGVKLSGNITTVDESSMTLSRDGATQLVLRHAVATIMPQDAFQIYDIMNG